MSKLEHSCRVPRLFKVASKILQLVQEKGASLKELVFNNGEKRPKHPNTKGLYALVVASIQNRATLDRLLRESGILVKEQKLDPWLARILMVELLWGKKRLPDSNAKPVGTVLGYRAAFLSILREASGDGTHEDPPRRSKGDAKPRYIRVNTLLMSVGDAVAAFREEGWRRATPAEDYATFLRRLAALAEDEFIQDFHVEQLFAFPPRTEFHGHELYRNGSLVLQDKATCLAPFLLDPRPGSAVLDMCAAPGMKTTQLAAMMENKGTLYAVEKHAQRYKTLSALVPRHGVTCATMIHADATTITPQECRKVKYILVDPTCSGSGMTRPGCPEDGDIDQTRLRKLSEFQVILLEKALLKFPHARRVVYSTCSVYPEENEEVVEKVLDILHANPDRPRFRLAEDVLASWPNRGSSRYQVGPRCLVTVPDRDLTTGCFIAVFERVEDAVRCDAEEEGGKKRAKKRKRKKSETVEESNSHTLNEMHKETEEEIVSVGEKRPKHKTKLQDVEPAEDNPSIVTKEKKKKRKKRKKHENGVIDMDCLTEDITEHKEMEEGKKKRNKLNLEGTKKRIKLKGTDTERIATDSAEDEKTKKSKKKRRKEETETERDKVVDECSSQKRKKKKKLANP